MPKTPHSSRNRSPSNSRSSILAPKRPPESRSSNPPSWGARAEGDFIIQLVSWCDPVGASLAVRETAARPSRMQIRAHRDVDARSLTGLFLFGLRLLQPLCNGGIEVFRQHRHQPVARSLQHYARLCAPDPLRLAPVRN